MDTSRMKQLPEASQVNTLLYLMGGKSNTILTTFKLTDAEKNSYTTVKERFNSSYTAQKTKMYARARFNQGPRNQKSE